MSEWIDVPVADVQVGDEVKVDGYGVLMTKPGFNYYAPEDDEEYRVVRLRNPRVDSVEVERIVDGIKFGEHTFAFRRSSIVSARRRKPTPRIPEPTHAWEVMCKVGVQAKDTGATWLCSLFAGHTGAHQAWEHHYIGGRKLAESEPSPKPGDWRCTNPHSGNAESHNLNCIVLRGSGGWSRDTRTGQPWVMQNGDPVEVVIPARIADISGPLRNADDTYMRVQKSVDESWADYYKRIGLDVRPADRRGKR